MGPNKILQALDDYDHMVAELAAVKTSLAAYTDIANQLRAENDAIKNQLKMQTDFLTRQVDAITAHRDRLQVALRGMMTRYKVIRECFAQCEAEALAEGLAANQQTAARDDGAGPAEIQALQDLALHDPSKRLPPPSYPQ